FCYVISNCLYKCMLLICFQFCECSVQFYSNC
uniref:Uncharacterized protein n=1 Tax=Amphimedon queenslandica TaxID=400682 RepID=A0A1X7T8Z3_AMPQE